MISELQASCLFFQWSFALGFNSLWFRFRLASPRFAFALCANQAACRNKCLTSVLSNSSGEYLWFSVFFFDFFLCESARQVFRFCVHNSKLTSFDHIKARNNIFKELSLSMYLYLMCNVSLQLITRTIPTTSAPGRIWHVTSSSWRRRQRQRQLWMVATLAVERRRSCAAAPVRRYTVSTIVIDYYLHTWIWYSHGQINSTTVEKCHLTQKKR